MQELEKAISKEIQDYVGSELKLSEQGCRPFFVAFRDGNMVGVVNGCNTPVLRMLIDLHLPKIKKKTEDEMQEVKEIETMIAKEGHRRGVVGQ